MMFETVLFFLAMSVGGNAAPEPTQVNAVPNWGVPADTAETDKAAALPNWGAAAPATGTAAVPDWGAAASQQVPEPQVPTGRFTTAIEVKPILTATRANWIALREYDGQDLLYVTHLMAWRCGLLSMSYSVNGGAMQTMDLPPCHTETAAPNALLPGDGLPYIAFPLGSVGQVSVELTYDDLTTDKASFARQSVLIP